MAITYGAHSYLFTDHWADDQLPHLDRARALGLGWFELSLGDDVSFEPALTRRHAESLDLKLSTGPGGLWPAECDLSADSAEERALGLAWHKVQVDCAGELGAMCYAGALYGHPGTVKRRRPPSGEYAWTAEGLHALAEYAARAGVKLVLEPMSHFRTHLVNTPEQLMQLIRQADHPNLYALLDTYHMMTEVRDYAKAIHEVATRLFSFHACGSDRGVPGGDLVPWQDVFSALKTIDFDGYILFETYNSAIGDFAYERAMFHDPCPDPDIFIQKGLAFLREGLA